MKTSLLFVSVIILLIGGYIAWTTGTNQKQTGEEVAEEYVEQFAFYKGGQNSENSGDLVKYDPNVIAKDSSVGASTSYIYQAQQWTKNTNIKSDISQLPLSVLLKRGGSYQCSWHHAGISNSQHRGWMFIHDSKILIELKVTLGSESNSVYFLARDGYVYDWNTSRPGGHKTRISPNDPNPKLGYLIIDDALVYVPNYNCQAWNNPDSSKFSIPQIKFKEKQ